MISVLVSIYYLTLIVFDPPFKYSNAHFLIWQTTPDGICGCAARHIMQSQHAMPSTDKLRGGSSLDVEPRSCHASAALKTSHFLSCLPLSSSSPCSFSRQRCTKLTFRSLQELLAGSLRGISQLLFSPGLRTPFLALFNQQQPSCLSPATQLLLLFTALYLLLCERGVCLCMCVCEGERERERVRVGEREKRWKGCKYACVCSLLNAPLCSLPHRRRTSCLSGFVLYKSVCLCLFAQCISICVCVNTSTTWFPSLCCKSNDTCRQNTCKKVQRTVR